MRSSRSMSSKLSTTISPTPRDHGEREFLVGLGVAVQHQPGRIGTRLQRPVDLAGARHVEVQALVHHHALNRRARERLRRERHVGARPPAAEGGQVVAGPLPQCRLRNDDGRGAELVRDVVEAATAHDERAVSLIVEPAGTARADRRSVAGHAAHACHRPSIVRGMAPEPRNGVRDRRARIAVAALFLTNGAIFANLVPRFPELKTDLALSNTAYGVAVAAFPAGALVAGPTAGALIRRFTSARMAVACTIGIAVLVLSPRGDDTAAAGRGTVRRRRLRRRHRRRAERARPAGAAALRPVDHQLAARDLVSRRGDRRRDGRRRDRTARAARRASRGGRSACSPRWRSRRTRILLHGPDEDDRGRGRRARADRDGGSTARCSPWWLSRSPAPRSRTPEARGPPCICATASAPSGPSRRSATSRCWAFSSSDG